MLKKILVPVDFSLHSEYALEVAACLARSQQAEIILLHMLGLSDGVFATDEAQEAAEVKYYLNLARKRFEEFLDKPYLKGVKVSEIVQNYKIFSEINAVAKENGADIIVMGSHGTGRMQEIFVGSNTEKVVRSSEVPVLVIKKQMASFRPRKVVYAIDFKSDHLKAYQWALEFFSQWDMEVHLLHVNLPNLQFLSTTQLNELTRKFLAKAHKGVLPSHARLAYVCDYSVEKGLYAYAAEVGADLIAVPTHGRSGLAHFFKGSIGEDITNHAPLPVITFKV